MKVKLTEEGWRAIESAPVAAWVRALTARGTEIEGRTAGRGTRGRRGENMVETKDGYRHACTHWRPVEPAGRSALQQGDGE